MTHYKYFPLKVPSRHTVRKKEILDRKKRCIDKHFIIAWQLYESESNREIPTSTLVIRFGLKP